MFVAAGIALSFFLWLMLRQAPTWQRVSGALGAAGTIWAVRWLSPLEKGAWWDDDLWRNLILFASMIIGMFFRVAWDTLGAYRRRRAAGKKPSRPEFDKWEFLYPALVSLLVFRTVAGDQKLTYSLCVASFHSGFFWNTLLSRTRQGA